MRKKKIKDEMNSKKYANLKRPVGSLKDINEFDIIYMKAI